MFECLIKAIHILYAQECKAERSYPLLFRGRQAPPKCYRQSFSRERPLTKNSACWRK